MAQEVTSGLDQLAGRQGQALEQLRQSLANGLADSELVVQVCVLRGSQPWRCHHITLLRASGPRQLQQFLLCMRALLHWHLHVQCSCSEMHGRFLSSCSTSAEVTHPRSHQATLPATAHLINTSNSIPAPYMAL